MRYFLLILIMAVAQGGGVKSALAADATIRAKILPSKPGAKKISGLEWESQELEVKTLPAAEELRSVVLVKGLFDKKEWTLLKGEQTLNIQDGKFTVELPMTGKALKFDLMAIGPLGEIEKQTVEVFFPEWESHKKDRGKKPPKRFYLTPGIGYSFLSYTETDAPLANPYTAHVLTAKVSYSFLLLPPSFDIGASGYMTVVPLAKNSNVTARFLGLNFRVGYILPFVKEPWRVSVMGGVYYTTMFVTPAEFGFKNMAGPQLFPVIRRVFKKGNSIGSYFKFSPVTDGFSVLSISNREMAAGIAYVHPVFGGHPMSFSVDVAQLSLIIQEFTITSNSLSIGIGYGF